MAVWRCPHCATPQPEAARCWVCHRSTTSCGTCSQFRRSVATGFGICGLDPRRVALTGSEMRACWTAPDPVIEDEPDSHPLTTHRSCASVGDHRPRTFVPVDELVVPATSADELSSPGWSLWGERDG